MDLSSNPRDPEMWEQTNCAARFQLHSMIPAGSSVKTSSPHGGRGLPTPTLQQPIPTPATPTHDRSPHRPFRQAASRATEIPGRGFWATLQTPCINRNYSAILL